MTVDGIVLAGESGRRMGAPKATVSLGGRTLVEHAVALLGEHCDRVVVSSRPEVLLPPLPVPVVMRPAGAGRPHRGAGHLPGGGDGTHRAGAVV
ncbi:MAG: NTP transferase domain-containing protein [Thermoleophilia bacterium]